MIFKDISAPNLRLDENFMRVYRGKPLENLVIKYGTGCDFCANWYISRDPIDPSHLRENSVNP